MKPSDKSRRSFLKNAALLSAASAFPTILTKAATPFGTKPIAAGEKVNLACIGIGNQGGLDVASFAKTGLANFVAFCDVDMGAPQTLKVLEQ
ncbi:MAG: twin-arginine translocation signal domain-containing protein, partial [Sediminibacterium sp.]